MLDSKEKGSGVISIIKPKFSAFIEAFRLRWKGRHEYKYFDGMMQTLVAIAHNTSRFTIHYLLQEDRLFKLILLFIELLIIKYLLL